ncbi:hypothetical protein MTR_3g005107 [Medicago truncatula]|uniref:Uncharacterized protein n=1 Tax=Medicago truncatula TaxID=3880 RepID=A0A072UT12_MEDTR|nr:hypothetical protein MTR_3g005107 [Medicago truncatula]
MQENKRKIDQSQVTCASGALGQKLGYDTLPPSSTEWHNHKKEDAVTWEDEYLDQHELFRKLIAIESGNKPPKPQKESNKAASILLDTPEKPKQQFEVIAVDEEDSMSLDLLQSLAL